MKKRYLLIIASAALCLNIGAQSYLQTFTFQRQAVVDLSVPQPDYKPRVMVMEMPKQGPDKKLSPVQYTSPSNQPARKPVPLSGLTKGQSFQANGFGFSTPCDNDMAISDSGLVISVANTDIFCRNTTTSVNLAGNSLALFTNPINNKHLEFDPKVLYDPSADRFILVCLVGNVDTISKVILGFSQSNSPVGSWNLYSLPGNLLGPGLWSDYPMIAVTKNELFLTVNLLYNDSSWQKGFVETVVWQLKKKNGYAGTAMASNLHTNIKYNGKPIRNLCPVKGGSQIYGPDMYFLSNRNFSPQNDTVFLVHITDTIGAATTTLTSQVLKTSQPYFFPPDGRQPINTQTLATNDSRTLGAFLQNNKIQYVHNTMNPLNNRCSVYHGVISSPGNSPTATGYILANDSVDFAYPNISYSGYGPTDDMAVISFDHSSAQLYPGVSAVQTDGNGSYSTILRIQNGSQYVNVTPKDLERWGDYSGSQRRYNNPGEVWMSGYRGYSYSPSFPNVHSSWVAQLTHSVTPFDDTSVEEVAAAEEISLFPNPASDIFTLEFELEKPEYIRVELFDAQGKLVTLLLSDWLTGKRNLFSFSTHDLPKGVYLLSLHGNQKTSITKKVIVN